MNIPLPSKEYMDKFNAEFNAITERHKAEIKARNELDKLLAQSKDKMI